MRCPFCKNDFTVHVDLDPVACIERYSCVSCGGRFRITAEDKTPDTSHGYEVDIRYGKVSITTPDIMPLPESYGMRVDAFRAFDSEGKEVPLDGPECLRKSAEGLGGPGVLALAWDELEGLTEADRTFYGIEEPELNRGDPFEEALKLSRGE